MIIQKWTYPCLHDTFCFPKKVFTDVLFYPVKQSATLRGVQVPSRSPCPHHVEAGAWQASDSWAFLSWEVLVSQSQPAVHGMALALQCALAERQRGREEAAHTLKCAQHVWTARAWFTRVMDGWWWISLGSHLLMVWLPFTTSCFSSLALECKVHDRHNLGSLSVWESLVPGDTLVGQAGN